MFGDLQAQGSMYQTNVETLKLKFSFVSLAQEGGGRIINGYVG